MGQLCFLFQKKRSICLSWCIMSDTETAYREVYHFSQIFNLHYLLAPSATLWHSTRFGGKRQLQGNYRFRMSPISNHISLVLEYRPHSLKKYSIQYSVLIIKHQRYIGDILLILFVFLLVYVSFSAELGVLTSQLI